MTDVMPPLGRPPENRAVRLFALSALVCGLGIGYFAYRRHAAAPRSAPLAAPALEMAETDTAPTPPPSELDRSGLHRASVVIGGPLETALVSQIGRGPGARLSQVVVRALAWWLDLPGDLRKGDRLDVLYEERPGEEPVVHALRFHSGKMGRLFRAYRFKPEGARYARLYQASGEEVEQRLVDGPLGDYEQVTSLLRDGRGHKGVDFKTPVGTVVKAPFDGVLVRRNWNYRLNGNSVEIRESGGARTAIFLHLAEVSTELRPGAHVSRGQVIAQSGNTGHSFAPHLHYQLQAGSVVLDPFQSHDTERRALAPSEKGAFEGAMHRFDGLLDTPGPVAGT